MTLACMTWAYMRTTSRSRGIVRREERRRVDRSPVRGGRAHDDQHLDLQLADSGRRPTVTDPGGNTGTRSTANTYNRETGRVTQGATVPDGKTCTAEITAQAAVTASG